MFDLHNNAVVKFISSKEIYQRSIDSLDLRQKIKEAIKAFKINTVGELLLYTGGGYSQFFSNVGCKQDELINKALMDISVDIEEFCFSTVYRYHLSISLHHILIKSGIIYAEEIYALDTVQFHKILHQYHKNYYKYKWELRYIEEFKYVGISLRSSDSDRVLYEMNLSQRIETAMIRYELFTLSEIIKSIESMKVKGKVKFNGIGKINHDELILTCESLQEVLTNTSFC